MAASEQQQAKRERDKYDEVVEYLTAHPSEIHDAWNKPKEHVAGCLFLETFYNCGCLTQAHSGPCTLWNPNGLPNGLGLEIMADERIPKNGHRITPEMLQPVFAEWNRRLDREIPGRLAPSGGAQ